MNAETPRAVDVWLPAGTTRIGWREAEARTGRRLDRRLSYFDLGGDLMVWAHAADPWSTDWLAKLATLDPAH